jgi:anti-sigma regulatory factor (Ser/Thr protein kinase)
VWGREAAGITHLTIRRDAVATDTVASTEFSLPSDPIAPALARAGVRSVADLPPAVAADLALLVTEVVSNAVRHAANAPTEDIVLRLSVDGVVRVEVVDRGPGFTAPARVENRPTGGWGLFLVDRLADAWGVDRKGPCNIVWFEFVGDR